MNLRYTARAAEGVGPYGDRGVFKYNKAKTSFCNAPLCSYAALSMAMPAACSMSWMLTA